VHAYRKLPECAIKLNFRSRSRTICFFKI